MKTLGRIIIILSAFLIIGGLMVVTVNASGNNAAFSREGGRTEFRPQGGEQGQFQFPPDGNRPPSFREGGEGREHGGPAGGGRWMFGLLKNLGVLTILVVAIVLPKSIIRKKKKATAVASNAQSS